MLLEIHPDNPSPRHIQQVVSVLRSGGVIIFPTDTIYAIGCDASNPKAFEKLCRIRGVKPQKEIFYNLEMARSGRDTFIYEALGSDTFLGRRCVKKALLPAGLFYCQK